MPRVSRGIGSDPELSTATPYAKKGLSVRRLEAVSTSQSPH